MEEGSTGKNSRILFLYKKLLCGQALRKDELARQFGVSEKSIQRDLDTIRDFLADEITEDGGGNQLVYDKNKGYYLVEDERMKLSDEEALAVSKILLDSRAFTREEMNSMLKRLIDNCVSIEKRKIVNDLVSNELYHYVELQHRIVFLDKLIPLGRAIQECRIIRIRYRKQNGQTVEGRRLEPLAIMFSEYYFYLMGFIEGINKKEAFENADDPFPTIYRIDRIEKLEILDEHFKVPYANRFEEGLFRQRVQFMYGGKLRRVRFKCQDESVEAVLDRLPTARILKEENGLYQIEAEVFGKGIDMWARSQGEYITDYEVI